MGRPTTADTEFHRNPDIQWHNDIATGTTQGAVAIVAGPTPDYGVLKGLLAQRIAPGADVARHVQRVALPQPGDDTELFRTIAYALERPLGLDRHSLDRQQDGLLWECWIIEGLEHDRWAILIKVHQRMAEDLSPAHLLAQLCDDADTAMFTSTAANEQLSPARTFQATWVDTLWQAPANVAKAAARAITGVAESAAATLRPAVVPPTTMRRYRTVRVPRATIDRIARKFGVTADDVALAAITEAFRAMLVRRGEQPRADSLRTLAPALPYLPVEHEDPIQRLRAVHARSGRAGERRGGESPLQLCARAVQSLTRMSRPDIVTLATDAPGPRRRLRLMGQRLERLLPIPPIALDRSTGVAILSYGDELVFGITADFDAAPDLDRIAAGIELGLARLVAVGQDSVLLFDRRRKRPRTQPNAAARWRPSVPPARVRH